MVVLEIETNQAGQRLDKFLGKYLPDAPASFFYKMLRKKNITLNDKKAEGREILKQNDRVTFWLADETILKFGGFVNGLDRENKEKDEAVIDDGISTEREAVYASAPRGQVQPVRATGPDREEIYQLAYKRLRDIPVLYEDEHVLILNKPAGILTQQAQGGDLSLNEWMIGYLLDAGAMSSQELRLFKPSVCNRLDRNTSGLVLCGKSLPGSQALSGLIRNRGVRKFYRTICVGTMENAAVIQGYLQKDPNTNQVMVFQRELPEAKYICTAYQPIKQLCFSAKETHSFTELEVELMTGKPHQIRAHLASIGHPLVGDSKYGDASVNHLFRQCFGLRWQLLHAYRLQFPFLDGVLAPLSGRKICAPFPADYKSILAKLNIIDS